MVAPLETPLAPIRAALGGGWVSRETLGEQAFHLRDVSAQHPDVFRPDQFIGQETPVTANLRFEIVVDRQAGEIVTYERTISFDAGDDEDDFYFNYHEAVRDALEEVQETYGDDYPDRDTADYESFGAYVSALA